MVFLQKKRKKKRFFLTRKNSNDKTEQIKKTNLSSIIGLQYSWHNAGS